MANAYKHKRYYKLKTPTNTDPSQPHDGVSFDNVTFTSTSDAITKMAFSTLHDANSVSKTSALEDSGTTLVITYEFESESDQTAWKAGIDGALEDSTALYNPTYPAFVYHSKTEWLHDDGSVSNTVTFEDPTS